MTTNNILSAISYCSNNTLCQIGNTCINNKCEHNSMVDFSINNSVGFIFIIISTAFCTVCSLSGTAINLSIIIFLLNFYPREAKILSHYTYIMPYVVNFITISTQMKNPFRNIKAIDYNITLIVSPMFIIGFIIGDVIIINEKRIYLLIGLCLCALVLWVYFIKYAYIFYYSQMKTSKEIQVDKTHHHINSSNNLNNDNNNHNIITEESEEERRELPTHKSTNFINETGFDDAKNWYEVGEATIRVSTDFVGYDNADPELGEVVLYPGSFLVGEVTNYNFTPFNTTIRVEDGQIVEMNRMFTP